MKHNGFTLVNNEGQPVNIGDELITFRGEKVTLKGGRSPHKSSSTGRVYLDIGEYFPSVVGLKWV